MFGASRVVAKVRFEANQAAPSPPCEGLESALSRHSRVAARGSQMRRKRSFTLVRSNSSCASWSGCSTWNTVSQRPRFPAPAEPCALRPIHLKYGPPRFIGVGGRFAARAGFVHAPVAFCPRGRYGRSPISWCTRREMSSRCSTRGVGDRPLVRLPLFLGRRGRRMEP
jgi:hypothetical protein